MKNPVFLTLIFTSFMITCQESSTITSDYRDQLIIEYRNIGKMIPTVQAQRWVDYYEKKNSFSGGRFASSECVVDNQSLNRVLTSVNSAVGLAFHYGIDQAGELQIVLIPVDESLALWNDISSRIYFNATLNVAMDQQEAIAITSRYKESYPDQVWFHFFGLSTFETINESSLMAQVTIHPALNDVEETKQLLLIVNVSPVVSSGRIAASSLIYDASYPCPKCAVN